VSGIDAPDRGQVWLGGQDVTNLPPHRRAVHTVFQNYALFPHLDVAGNICFPLRAAKIKRSEQPDRVREALRWVQLDRFADRRVTELSGGERQRVALARALVDEPECVLLDEPLSALDPHLRGQTLALLQEIQVRLGATYLYVTHDREEALRAAHRVGVLREGRLEQVGTPDEVYRRPANPFVAGFVGPINWLMGEVCGRDGRVGIRLASGHEVPCDSIRLPDAGRLLVGVRPEHVRIGADGFLPVSVVNRQFAGATVSLSLSAAADVLLTADLHVDAHHPSIGQKVKAGWDITSAHVFAFDEKYGRLVSNGGGNSDQPA
jgi:ABC-type Fe3+/spermidine/putrescine transport system ATPase subunit